MQTGLLEEAVGVAGAGFTTTLVVPAAEVQLPTVTVTLYVPPLIAAAAGIVGFWRIEVKPFGPVQDELAPTTVGVVRLIAGPAQSGLSEHGAGRAGAGLTTTL